MMEQGSQEWINARLGKATASRVPDIVAKTQTKAWSSTRANYMAELLVERLTGQPAPAYVNDAMRHGTEHEPTARATYEFMADVHVEQVGFIDHPFIPMAGASPDGFVGDDGLVEIKCPNTATHVDTLLGGSVPSKYITQMMWQMACTGRAWCDFVSFDPRLPPQMQLFIKRVERDDKTIKQLENDIAAFLGELDGKISELRKRFEKKEAA